MKVVRTNAPPAPKERTIMRFPQPAPAAPPPAHPHVRSSNEVAAHAVRVASSPGGIDPRQMRS
jgi:FtsP/CotA-like multicopper oxidase with cupredoxin domain